MSADPYMERVQRRVLDLAAEVSWRDARLAEVAAAGRIDGKADDWDFDYGDARRAGFCPDCAEKMAAAPSSVNDMHDWRTIVTPPDIAAASSLRPSLWQRTPEWAIWLGTGILIVALLALPVIA